MSRPSLILLRSDEPHHEALERLLATHFDLRAVVVEPGGAQRQMLFHSGRKQAYRWRIYHMWRRRLMGSARFRRKFFAKVGGLPDVNYGSTVVDSINDPAVHQILQNIPHSFIIVIGTSILSPTSLTASSRRFINIHGGCLPHYKGNHCVFMAYLDEREDCLAATIHYVDEGIDTGGIIAVCAVDELSAPILAGPEYFYCAAELRAFNKIIELISKVDAMPSVGEAQSQMGRTFRMSDRTPLCELAFCAVQILHVWRRLWRRFRGDH
jgi:hypothetical protein